ncbi:hypothetical protein ARMGADRAFT_1131295 [Armillaria gallica]|uniref:Uncharacterized protein n=1 Tax=Armillaria gallica TaxID=47427 RepID=A0A2H3EBW0_ARMGA|nr:hypothetical protein ARMGADRAFT_1131295 [Armillaria gallica]
MVTQTYIPPDLTDDDKAVLFRFLDAELNATTLYALLYVTNKCWPIRRALVVVIILLHALITINFAACWSSLHFAFIKNGQSFWNVFLNLQESPQIIYWGTGISASISTILADSYIIWCCWMVWGQHWPVVLLPIFSLVTVIVSRTMGEYFGHANAFTEMNISYMIYSSFVLATTLSCTLLIIYRVVAVAGIRHGPAGRLGVFRRFIGVLVESSALYSISIILYLAFFIRNDFTSIAKGVAPTLLIGRVAAGHTCPRDNSNENTMSSLHFQTSSAHSTAISQLEESTVQSSVLAMDIEAQTEQLLVSIEQDTMVSMTSRADILD